MEAQAALVGAECTVVLHAEATVDVSVALVVGPRHAEDDLAFRLAKPLDESGVGVAGVAFEHYVKRLEDLCGGLMELGLSCIANQNLIVNLRYAVTYGHRSPTSL